jgi:hypothetical protein
MLRVVPQCGREKNFSVRTDLLIEIKEDSKISLRNHHYQGIEYLV